MPITRVRPRGPYTRHSAAAGEPSCSTFASARRSPLATAPHSHSASAARAFCWSLRTFGGTVPRPVAGAGVRPDAGARGPGAGTTAGRAFGAGADLAGPAPTGAGLGLAAAVLAGAGGGAAGVGA